MIYAHAHAHIHNIRIHLDMHTHSTHTFINHLCITCNRKMGRDTD